MLNRQKKVLEFFDKTENYLHKDFGVHSRKDILTDLLGKLSDKRILDIGCGNGLVTLNYGINNSLTMVDISKNMIQLAKHNAELGDINNAKFLVSSLEDLVIRDQYDVIVAFGFLAHVDSVKTTIIHLKKRFPMLFLRLLKTQEWFFFQEIQNGHMFFGKFLKKIESVLNLKEQVGFL